MSFIATSLKNLSLTSKSKTEHGAKISNNKFDEKEPDFKLRVNADSCSFVLWKDAMKMVARLPDGIPKHFRKQLWLTLAKRSLEAKNIDLKFAICLSESRDPDESELGAQIIKDLHRTGCSPFSGDVGERNQGRLKRVLVAYARWNPAVGYCQGFNMLAALILEVVEWVEEDALMVMIFLIEGVLPESYFADSLRGLSVDMAVFRDLLRLHLAPLARHLDRLQEASSARDTQTGVTYEPPLPNVFTMQWFLTLFTTCLPRDTVLRVWDLVLLEGSEVLLRAALAIWQAIADRIMAVESADEFYCIMGVLMREILEFGLMDPNMFVKTVVTLAPFPFPQLQELRDSYAYNICPLLPHDVLGEAEESLPGTARRYLSDLHWGRRKGGAAAFGNIGPGAFGAAEGGLPPGLGGYHMERMSLDISSLKKQYVRLKERQRQAHVIISGAFENHLEKGRRNSLAVNHLLMGKQPLVRRKSNQYHFVFPERQTSNHKLPLHKSPDEETEEKFDTTKKNDSDTAVDAPPSRSRRCGCDASFTCPLHAALPEKSAVLDPFPTKRRVGSVRSR